MGDIKMDLNNYRVHNDRNKDLIKKSLSELGAGRSVLIDNDGYIIAGNGTYEQAQKLGIPVRVIKTDGKELIAVKRIDLSNNDERRFKLAVMDNSTSDASKFDTSKLETDFSVDELKDFGVPVIESSVPVDSFFDKKEQKEKKKKRVKCPFCGEFVEV